ncbi:MAG: aspartate kinase [Bacteroidales bacterium]|nr:aspartate kinase [Bacteroidales bacterium]
MNVHNQNNKLKVFKFGGASVQDAQSIINLAGILKKYNHKPLIVVISAMNKTTRQLIKLTQLYFKSTDYQNQLKLIIDFHQNIINELFIEPKNINYEFEQLIEQLNQKLTQKPSSDYDFEYDQIVVYGELFSTKIIAAYLKQENIDNEWVDIRKLIKTDAEYANAKPDWQQTAQLLQKQFKYQKNTVITQGFIASNQQGFNTSLGIEGSDFSAAIIAYSLNAQELVVWKDVAGFYSSDPKLFKNVVKLDAVSFHEAVELAYYGAKIIHPKTIKPLQNKKIPLHVKSFINPDLSGTLIKETTENNTGLQPEVPVFITKNNQILISIAPQDFSFIAEDNLSDIFSLMARFRIKVNLMQNSAISFSICVDYEPVRIKQLLLELKNNYKVLYNTNLTLITIRHYNSSIIEELTVGRKIFVQQKSRNTARFVVK